MKHGLKHVLAGWAGAALLLPGALAQAAQNDSEKKDFQAWLEDFRAEARAEGISTDTLDTALSDIGFKDRVIELDRNQPEFKLTYQKYMNRVLTEKRIARGRRKLEANGELLDKIADRYGVPARFLVALWGIETGYGSISGGFKVIPALATLTYDGRRGEYFRKQLLHALHILDSGHVVPDEMKGSWAGAMGQPQFMPSSFRNYAVDFDGDGRKDIWNTKADVFASAANYLSELGWKRGWTWGRAVSLPEDFDTDKADLDTTKKLAAWADMGVTRANGEPLPDANIKAAVLIPKRSDGEAFVVYHNFRVLLKWNRSNYFGLAVGRLADAIGGR